MVIIAAINHCCKRLSSGRARSQARPWSDLRSIRSGARPHVELRFLESEEKLARFKAAGIDEVVFLEFTPALAAMTPEEFADIVLHRRLRYRTSMSANILPSDGGAPAELRTWNDMAARWGSPSIPSSPSC